MGILPKSDIEAAIQQGLVKIDGCKSINATSADIRIGKLLTPAVERRDMKEVPFDEDGCWITRPDKFYLWETMEEFYLAPGFSGQINSRSSWARFGVASRDQDDEFRINIFNEYNGKVVCSMNTLGTTVKVKPGDTIAQVHLAYDGFEPVLDNDLEMLIKEGDLEITRNGDKIDSLIQPYVIDGKVEVGCGLKGQKMNGGFTLTTDDTIRMYTGKLIDPHHPDPACFVEMKLPSDGLYIPRGKFFLSASAESVKIGSHFAGWVGEYNHLLVTSGYRGPGMNSCERPSTLQTHAAAPKIDPYPRFQGKITFENHTLADVIIKPGQRLAELYLMWLHSPYVPDGSDESRYKGQDVATASKAHLDKK
jgi:deoxycytidine triphosphate deaminase